MKIEQCRVEITSKEEFDKVSKICLANGIKWYHQEDDKYDTVCGDIRVLLIDHDYELLFVNYNQYNEHMTFKEFINKYDNDKDINDKVITLITKLNNSLFRKKRPTLNQKM